MWHLEADGRTRDSRMSADRDQQGDGAGNRAPGAVLIPRRKLFANPDRTQARISPDGSWLSWLAPQDGVLNVWVAPAGDVGAARCLTSDRKSGIHQHFWPDDRRHL